MNTYNKVQIKRRLNKRYFRQVIGHPDGAIVHHGDCGIYACDIQVCTCGLHHDLAPIGDGLINEIYPKYWEELDKTMVAEIVMRAWNTKQLFSKCKKCEGDGEDVFCQQCYGLRFVEFQMPEPCSYEEMIELMKQGGWKFPEEGD